MSNDRSSSTRTAGRQQRLSPCRVVIWFAATLICMGGAIVRGGPLETFQSEYPPAAVRLEEFYSHVKILSTETLHDNDGGFSKSFKSECLREGGLVRGVKVVIRSASPQVVVGSTSVFGGARDSYFDLYRKSDAAPFVFNSFGPKPDFDGKVRMSCPAVFAPYCALDLRIADYIREPNVKVASASTAILDGRRVVDVLTEETTPGQGVKRHHFFFDPNSWALAGWRIALAGDRRPPQAQLAALHGRVTYETGQGPPRVKEVETWGDYPSNPGTRSQYHRTDVTSVEFGPVDKKQFTLGALGVEEPVLPSQRARVRLLWVILTATLLGALGVWFYVLARRRAAAGPPANAGAAP